MGRRSYTPPRICLIYKLYTTRRVTWPATWAARGQMVRNLSVPKHGAVGLLPVSAPISVDLEIPARSVEIVAANERAPCGNGRGWPMESSSGVRWLVRDCRARRKWLPPHTTPATHRRRIRTAHNSRRTVRPIQPLAQVWGLANPADAPRMSERNGPCSGEIRAG